MFKTSFTACSLLTVVFLASLPVFSANAGKLLFNPREAIARKFIGGQSTTLVIADNVNVRNRATVYGSLRFADF